MSGSGILTNTGKPAPAGWGDNVLPGAPPTVASREIGVSASQGAVAVVPALPGSTGFAAKAFGRIACGAGNAEIMSNSGAISGEFNGGFAVMFSGGSGAFNASWDGSGSMVGARGSIENLFPQRALARFLPSLRTHSPLGMRCLSTVQ